MNHIRVLNSHLWKRVFILPILASSHEGHDPASAAAKGTFPVKASDVIGNPREKKSITLEE